MKKSPDAFRTISEVAAWLETPAHVLRFWESRFPELKPVQRAGGRRYYRPEDMLLLGGIKHLLHTEGHTIKSVQDRIKADGTDAVAGFSPPLAPVAAETATMGCGATAASATDRQVAPVEDVLATTDGDAAPTLAVADDSAPPIGFFFDDSEDAAPAEAQSGTFDQPAALPPLVADPAPVALPDDPPAAPGLGILPPTPDDPKDDAAGYGLPLCLPARLRALEPADIARSHRYTLIGLFRRLDGWRRAQA